MAHLNELNNHTCMKDDLMKKNLLIIISIMIYSTSFSMHAFSFKSLYSYFVPEKNQAIEQQEIPLENRSRLVLETIKGPVQIKTWKQQKILLKATKHAGKEEFLPQMSIYTQSNNDTITIKTIYDQDKIKGSVEYQLLLPAHLNIAIHAQMSTIDVEHINGTIEIMNTTGNVELNAIKGSISVDVKQKGSIAINQPENTVKAFTHNGTIEIQDAKKSVFAATDGGKIKASCKSIPQGCTVKLDATGQIILELPTGINADIQAETEHGYVLCQHYITIKPFITQLNAQAWNQFKRSVTGSLGNGGAHICLNSVSGTIKIAQETTP